MHKRLALRYARALMETAQAENAVEQVSDDIGHISDLFEQSPELYRLIERVARIPELLEPVINALKSSVSPCETTVRFMSLLAARKRLSILYDIAVVFTDLLLQKKGILQVTVTSSRKLQNDETKSIGNRLKSIIPSPITIEWVVDPAILGGLRIQIGSEVYDGSLEARIQQLRNQLIQV